MSPRDRSRERVGGVPWFVILWRGAGWWDGPSDLAPGAPLSPAGRASAVTLTVTGAAVGSGGIQGIWRACGAAGGSVGGAAGGAVGAAAFGIKDRPHPSEGDWREYCVSFAG
eukprot:970700-Prorocentrum_minimum.AAC.1